MNRFDLQRISRIRRQEARVLLQSGHYSGAYYLAGYAVECALKACVARTVRRFDYPDRNLANKAFSHDLKELLRIAALEPAMHADSAGHPRLLANWTVAKDWTVDSRYSATISKELAQRLYSACTARVDGVLPWIRRRW